MAIFRFPLAALAALLVLLLQGAAAHALNTKSWVSNAGSDGSNCTLAQPCGSFQAAHDQTSPGGEVGVLTPGNYAFTNSSNGLTISKSINITNDGVGEAGMASLANGQEIFVGAGDGDVVSLRGLVLDGLLVLQAGIKFQTGLALHVQNCVIRNFHFGIIYFVGVNNAASRLFVSDSIIFNNGTGPGSGGIVVRTITGSHGSVALDRVHLENNVDGLFIDGKNAAGAGTHTVVRDSVISGNAQNGIHAFTLPGKSPAFALVEGSSIVNNRQNGILVDGPGATVLLNDSTVARNAVGISTVNSGQLLSYRNNRINNNIGPDGAPTSFLDLN